MDSNRNSKPRRLSARKISDAWKRFHASPDGRAAIADYLVTCNVYNPIDSSDPIECHRMEGERRAALRIVSLLSLRHGDFVSAAQEDTEIAIQMSDFHA